MQKIYLGIIGLILLGCTGDYDPDNNSMDSNSANEVSIIEERTSTIPSYRVVFDSSKMSSFSLLDGILLDLENSFEKYTFKSTSNELKEKIENVEAKRFQKSLSADFDNDLFKSIHTIDFVSVSPKNKEFNSIQIEQWSFESAEMVDSCFESLTRYEEKEIHFMTVNWIWFKQESNLFFVSSLSHNVKSNEMQSIKKILSKEIEKKGSYECVSFYE
jgi:hypothetical protein